MKRLLPVFRHRILQAAILLAAVLVYHNTLAETFVLPTPDTEVVGQVRVVIAQASDTLLDIARRHGLGYNEITAANPGVDPWLPGAGTRVVLPTQFILPGVPHRGIVINIAQMRLYYFPPPRAGEAARVVTHPIGIGREYWGTPLGETKVAGKSVNPAWHVPKSIRKEHLIEGDPLPPVVPPGPGNPLGQYALRLGLPGYLIHGTNKPWGVGMRVSHGCIRLYPEDISTLFQNVPPGTRVKIVSQPYSVARADGNLYLQAFPTEGKDITGPANDFTSMVRALLPWVDKGEPVDWSKAIQVVRDKRGIPTPISPGTSTLSQVLAGAPLSPDSPAELPPLSGQGFNGRQ